MARSSRCSRSRSARPSTRMYIGFNSDVLAPQQDHRLSRPRRAAQAAGGARACKPPRSSARRISRCAPGSIPTKTRGLWLDRGRCQHGAGQQRLHLRPRQHQGPDGAGQPHRLDQSSFGRRVRESRAQAGERRRSCGSKTSPMSRSAPTTTNAQVGFDGKKAVYIGIAGGARRQPARRDRGRATRSSPTSRRNCRRGSTAPSSTTRPTS